MSEYEILLNKIEKNKDLEIEDINREEIKDVKNIKINKNLSAQERILDYLREVDNPYILRVNDTLVKITYGTKNIDFMQCLGNIVKNNV